MNNGMQNMNGNVQNGNMGMNQNMKLTHSRRQAVHGYVSVEQRIPEHSVNSVVRQNRDDNMKIPS